MDYKDKITILGRGLVYIIDGARYDLPKLRDRVIFDGVVYEVRGTETMKTLMDPPKRIGDFGLVVSVVNPQPIAIMGWEDLSKLQPSATHKIEVNVEDCNGWVEPIDNTKRSYANIHYLSTHTFYQNNFKESTAILRKFGFDVQLDNWG
jgi:hypothetical protein